MKETTNYKLNQWEMSDRVLMEDFNSDNRKVEDALVQLGQLAAGKAEQSALDALAGQVAAKAEQSALNAEAAARQGADSAEATARANADNTEQAAREAADSAEATARANADGAEQAARISADNAEKNARETADGALGGRIDALTPKAGAQFIKTLNIPGGSDYVNVPLGINWGDWNMVHLLVKLALPDGARGGLSFDSSHTIVTGNPYDQHLILFPCYHPELFAGVLCFPGDVQHGPVLSLGGTYQQLTTLTVYLNDRVNLLPGGTITVYGEK